MDHEARFAELKRYVRFTAAEIRALHALRPRVEPHFDRIVGQFYERVREHEDAHAVLVDEAQVNRLKASMREWLVRLFSSAYDADHFERTSRIGDAHVRVGLPDRYMFTAMSLMRRGLLEAAAEDGKPVSFGDHLAITTAIDLELAVMVGAYGDALAARIRNLSHAAVKSADDKLERLEARYAAAIEHTDALVVALTQDGEIRLFNAGAEQTTGYARDEAMNRPFGEIFFDDDSRAELMEDFLEVCRGLRASFENRTVPVTTRARKHRHVRWSVRRTAMTADDDVVAFAHGRDVTDEHRLEEETRRNEKLAAVGTLAAGLAHEIRNPLNGAHLHLSFLERGLKKSGADADTLEAVAIVGDEIKRLAQLVTEFLDFARPKPLRREATSLRGLCKHVMALSESKAHDAKVELKCDLPESDFQLDVDKAKLEQVLLNLVQNAIEAHGDTPDGTVVVRGRRAPLVYALEVEDDGPGLPTQDAPIFDAFFSTKEGGTGLGLAITHRIVTDHGGTIAVDSKPGRTVFRIELPIHAS